MISNIVGCAQTPQSLVLDMALDVMFKQISSDIAIPVFRPAEASA